VETIKTACMVIVLMAIGYGVYTVLNQPEEIPPEVAGHADDTMQLDMPDFSNMAMTPSSQPGFATSPPPSAESSPAPNFDMPPIHGDPNTTAAPPLDAQSEAPSFSAAGTADLNQGSAPAPNFPAVPDLPPLVDGNAAKLPDVERMEPSATLASASSRLPQTGSTFTQANASNYVNGQTNPAASDFQRSWDEAQVYLRQNELVEAVRVLTSWRNRPELTPSQKEDLDLLLSQLAGTVVYSTQHMLEEPYAVGSGETLESIAERFQVPSVLLQRINGLDSNQSLVPGQKLKVIRGPFTASVDLTHKEVVLKVDGCYAGRFPISLGNGAIIPAGEHEVLRKEQDPQYFDDAAGQVVRSGDPNNPYGRHAVHLDGGIVLHGQGGSGGSISLTDRDAEDIYGILSIGSRVTVQR